MPPQGVCRQIPIGENLRCSHKTYLAFYAKLRAVLQEYTLKQGGDITMNTINNQAAQTVNCGGESLPDGTFHGGESIPDGTFHGGESIPDGTFHANA